MLDKRIVEKYKVYYIETINDIPILEIVDEITNESKRMIYEEYMQLLEEESRLIRENDLAEKVAIKVVEILKKEGSN